MKSRVHGTASALSTMGSLQASQSGLLEVQLQIKMCVATDTSCYNPQEATSPQASPLHNCLLSPVLCRGTELGLLRWCHHTLHNHNSSPLGAKVLSFQPWTPKVKTGCKPKFMASVTTLINVTKATLCGSMCNRGLID